MRHVFPAAVRVGYDPKIVPDQLGRYVASKYPNGSMKENPHGIENYSTTPNTINEMLCMSHVPVSGPDRAESVLRVFPVWPKDRDARFTNIRAWGAFLISGALQGGTVRNVTILSERSRDCTVVNPWPARKVQHIRDGKKAEVLQGDRFTFPTGVADMCELIQMP